MKEFVNEKYLSTITKCLNDKAHDVEVNAVKLLNELFNYCINL